MDPEETCTESLISELQRQLDQSVVFYTADGYAYYAKVKDFLHDHIVLLVPGAGQTKVIIRHPDQSFMPNGGESFIREDYTYLDLLTVVATTIVSTIPLGFALV